MGRLDIVIPDELERKLRIEIVERLGGKKGDMSKAISEAIEQWLLVDEYFRILLDKFQNMKQDDKKKLLNRLDSEAD